MSVTSEESTSFNSQRIAPKQITEPGIDLKSWFVRQVPSRWENIEACRTELDRDRYKEERHLPDTYVLSGDRTEFTGQFELQLAFNPGTLEDDIRVNLHFVLERGGHSAALIVVS